jgi:Ion channel.
MWKKKREFIYELVTVGNNVSAFGRIYDILMVMVIFFGLFPLFFKGDDPAFRAMDQFAAWVFIIDYILRLTVADLLIGQKGWKAFLRYLVTPMAIIDLLSILPTFITISGTMRVLRLTRLVRTFKVFRFVVNLEFSRNVRLLGLALKKQARALELVFGMALAYILVCAVVIYNVEPDTFNNFFDAFYWAVISLATIGYGDLYPITLAGKIVTVISAMAGIVIVALPAGIITAGYMNELNKHLDDDIE